MDSRFGVGNRVKRHRKASGVTDERYQDFSISAASTPAGSREASPDVEERKKV
jgi:hypothetical protein